MNTKVNKSVFDAIRPCRKGSFCKAYLAFAPFALAASASQKNAEQLWTSLLDESGKVKKAVRFKPLNGKENPPHGEPTPQTNSAHLKKRRENIKIF